MAGEALEGIPANASFPPDVIDRVHEHGRNGSLPHPWSRRPPQAPDLRRPCLPDGLRLPVPAGGLSGALRDEDGARRPPRCDAARIGHPHHHRRHELRRAVGAGQGSPGSGGHRSRHVDHDGRRRHDPRGTQGLGSLLVYQVLPSRYGFDPADLRQADAVEIVIGQGAKPGGGGLLLGQKVNERVASMRTLPPGIDQRSASRHPDWVGPDDLRIKIEELREATDWSVPVYVKIGATRVDHDVKLAVAAGADVVVVDGMQGGTAATQDVFIEHAGIPTLPAVRMAAEALPGCGRPGRGAADRVRGNPVGRRCGQGAGPRRRRRVHRGGRPAGAGLQPITSYRDADGAGMDVDCRLRGARHRARWLRALPHRAMPGGHHHAGPRPRAAPRFRPGRRAVANYLRAITMEVTALARACGKSAVHHLEPEDLVALTVEAAAMARVPLAGTNWIPGWPIGTVTPRPADIVVIGGGVGGT